MSKNVTITVPAHVAEMLTALVAGIQASDTPAAPKARRTRKPAARKPAARKATPAARKAPAAKPAAKVERKPAKAAKAPAPKAPKADGSATVLNRKTLPQFKRTNAWAAGMSMSQVAEQIIGGAAFEGAWMLGAWGTKVTTGSFAPKAADATTALVAAAVAEAKVERKAPKARKAKATKAAKAQPAKAERAPEPEYGTEAWIAWARPTDDGAPRTAANKVTAKAQWPLRMHLAETGQYDRFETDTVVEVFIAQDALASWTAERVAEVREVLIEAGVVTEPGA